MQILSILANSDAYEAGQQAGKVFGMVFMVIIIIAVPAFFILSLIKALTKKTKGWVICLIISSLLLLSFGVLVGIAAVTAYRQGKDNSTSEYSVDDSQMQTVVTDDGLLSFELPSNWKEVDELHDEASLKYGHLRSEQYMLVLSENKSDFEEDVSLRDYADLCLENAELATSGMRFGEWTEHQIANRKMLKVQMSATVDRIKIKYQYGYYETKDHYHQIMQWTLPSKWGSSQPLFNVVLDSAKPLKDQ